MAQKRGPGRRSVIYGAEANAKYSGAGLPVTIEAARMEKAGFAPERLDGVIETLIKNAEAGAELLGQYTPLFAGLMAQLQLEIEKTMRLMIAAQEAEVVGEVAKGAASDLEVTMSLAEKVSQLLERLNRMTMQAVKAKDEAARLRLVLAGDDQRGDLEQLSEVQLKKIVMEAAAGWTKAADV